MKCFVCGRELSESDVFDVVTFEESDSVVKHFLCSQGCALAFENGVDGSVDKFMYLRSVELKINDFLFWFYNDWLVNHHFLRRLKRLLAVFFPLIYVYYCLRVRGVNSLVENSKVCNQVQVVNKVNKHRFNVVSKFKRVRHHKRPRRLRF